MLNDFKNTMLNYVRKSQDGTNSKINSITKTGNLSYDVNITETSDIQDDTNINITQKFTFKEYNNKLVVDTYSKRD